MHAIQGIKNIYKESTAKNLKILYWELNAKDGLEQIFLNFIITGNIVLFITIEILRSNSNMKLPNDRIIFIKLIIMY